MSDLDTVLRDVSAQPDTGTVASAQRAIQDSLGALRSLLHMEVAFVSRFAGGRRSFEFVDSDPGFSPVRVGDSDPLEATYCARVIDGRIAQLIPDARRVPELRALPATHGLPVGAHLSVPILDSDERPMGTLCCFSRAPDMELRARDLELLTVFSSVIRGHLDFLRLQYRRENEMRARFDAVMATGGPTIALQPIVEIATGRTSGYEALSRFPRFDDWTPDRWFREADLLGLGNALEASAVRAALSLLPRLPTRTSLSVNVSARALCSSDELTGLLVGPSSSRLVLELTEHAQVDDYDELLGALQTVRAAGVRVAVDDAGSGYAGLEHILRLQPEVLKLDRTLVDGVAHHLGRQAMCIAMVGFTQRMDTSLVAEGVETKEDLEVLAAVGVPLAQGYLLGRPEARDSHN